MVWLGQLKVVGLKEAQNIIWVSLKSHIQGWIPRI